VDLSVLNSKPQPLAQNGRGESSQTFFGLLGYVKSHKPSVLILENVKADKVNWETMVAHYNDAGYATEIIDVDTKNFYLPQTRQRRYMVCIRGENGPKKKIQQSLIQVKAMVNSLQRPASCPAGFFLLDENSKQMNQIVNDRDIVMKKKRMVTWTEAQKLHRTQREVFNLGQQKPISQPGSKADALKGPEFYMHKWFNPRTEREKDLLDIIYLKGLKGKDDSAFDINYKERWIDISQAVDRAKTATKGFGNVGCVTPKGIHFCSSRGGPLTGQEALAMQGLPLSRMIFTRETQDELQQLAGNAMTSTVVCAVVLATLTHGFKFLTQGPIADHRESEKANALDFEAELQKAKFEGEDLSSDRVAEPMEQIRNLCNDIERLQKWASDSSRYCYCEKQSETQSKIFMCTLCGHTACDSCNRDPPHGPTRMASIQRLEPLEFIKNLRIDLPMRLSFEGLDGNMFDQLLEPTLTEHDSIDVKVEDSGEETRKVISGRKTKSGKVISKRSNKKKVTIGKTAGKKTRKKSPASRNTTASGSGAGCSTVQNASSTESSNMILSSDDCQRYRSVIEAAVADIVHFVEIKRAEAWTVFYEGPNSTLQLVIGRKSIQWLFFAKPPPDYPARCLLREIFAKPIAKMTPSSTLLEGRWKINEPISTQLSVNIRGINSGQSHQIPAYPARCGISHESIAKKKVWKRMSVELGNNGNLECDLNGNYELLPNCGTAFGCLYKKEETEARADGDEDRSIFLFFDPQKCSDVRHDSFVFSFEHDRIAGYAPRVTIAELSHEWRSEHVTKASKPVDLFYRSWQAEPRVKLIKVAESEIQCQPLIPLPTVSFGGETSHVYNRLLVASGPATILDLPHQHYAAWKHHDIERFPDMVKEIAWAFERVSLQMGLEGWQDVEVDGHIEEKLTTICEVCHPQIPDPGNNQEAIAYERFVKTKWPKWIVRTCDLHDDKRTLQFALNIRAMAHTACQNMLDLLKGRIPQISWRLESNHFDVGRKYHGKFRLKDTNEVSPRMGLPAFLREEQQRSLDWMIGQEKSDIEPFIEMEVDEAPLPALAWRAEVKVTTESVIRGGLCADEVGFGKTALMLALIYSQWGNGWNENIPAEAGLEKHEGTIIIAPSNIIEQWLEETDKFLTKGYRKSNLVDIKSVADFKRLENQAREDNRIERARIVLVNVNMLHECVHALKKYKWARLVIDEYHLLWDKKKLSPVEPILSLNAYSKWILSGTPPLEDFADVKTIATLLGAHLGIDNDGDLKSTNKRLAGNRRQYSDLQKLEIFDQARSETWYKNRRSHAQEFLNRFARQNHTEQKIPCDIYYDGFHQSEDEQHVYLLLERHLREHGNLNIREKSKLVGPGLRSCLNELISSSGAYEHSLLLCSLSATYTSSPYRIEICDDRIKELNARLKSNWQKLQSKCASMMTKYDGRFNEFSKLLKEKLLDKDGFHGFGDPDIPIHVAGILGSLLKKTHQLECASTLMAMDEDGEELEENTGSEENERIGHADEEKEGLNMEEQEKRSEDDEGDYEPELIEDDPEEDEENEEDSEEDFHDDEQNVSHMDFPAQVIDQVVRRFEHLAKINQDLRFWNAAKRLHPDTGNKDKETCSSCLKKIAKPAITILRPCGHTFCKKCLGEIQDESCRVDRCSGRTALSDQFRQEDFGKDNNDEKAISKHSSKLQELIRIIKETPPDDQVLVFCQYRPMFKMIESSFENAGIGCICPEQDKVDTAIEQFKKKQGQERNSRPKKVLILHLGGEDMAGQ
jgi:site-specific DNA-cytosine methylase